MTASFDLQVAIVAALSAHAGVCSLAGNPPRIFDDLPERAIFPYLAIGDDDVRDWSTGSERGAEHELTIHVWSRYAGRREAKLLMDAIIDAIDDQALSVNARRLVNLRFLGLESFRLGDGETWHGLIRFRAVTESV